MSTVTAYLKGKPTVILLALPLFLFALLRLFPALDAFAWSVRYTRLFQFYAGSLISLLALITALSAGTTLGAKTNVQALFVTFAFIALSALLLVSSVATPGILIPGSSNVVFIWSAHLSFPAGAMLFAIASIRWSRVVEARVMAKHHFLWLSGGLLFLGYLAMAVSPQSGFKYLSTFTPVVQYILAAITFIFLFIASRRIHIITQQQGNLIENSMVITFVLLVEAQICLTFGEPDRLSWLLYHPLTLAALIVALKAMLTTMETSPDLRLARYFATLGSITIFGTSLIIGEVGKQWLPSDVGRSFVVPLALAQGTLSFLVLFLIVLRLNRLVTERTLALKQEQHLRSELFQLIVHDLKSPLSVIKGGINLLAKGRLGPLTETQTRLLTSLEQSGDDILRMINDLLDVERMEAGALKLHLGMVEPETLLHESVNDLQIVASTYKQNLTISHPAMLPRIQVDKSLLRRVLNNLLTNALNFAPEEGDVSITAAVEGTHLTISVADNGPGVPPADRERIFEKFVQVQGTERRGAGLGLAFCKMAVEAHGGTIRAGESPSGGALFKIMLPLKQTPGADMMPQGYRLGVGGLTAENKAGR
ncbi:MAG TPA: ATP-binding protein [Anaerolineae bacterium]